MVSVKVLETKIPVNLYEEIEKRIHLGLFSTESEVVGRALRKAFAEEAREFLREYIKNLGVSKRSLLAEWKKVRH